MSQNTIQPQQKSQEWLLSSSFDRFFIFGTMLLAVSCGILGVVLPYLFVPILLLNLWFLGYHHVIATFTRLCFDYKSHRRSIILLYVLIPFVMLFVVTVVHFFGLWPVTTIYLYAQWFHYSRQSWGISRAYERKAPPGYTADRSWQTKLAFYGVPVWGILYRSWQDPDLFLSLPIKTIPVPYEVVATAGAVCIVLLAWWILRVYQDWRKGVLPLAYTAYMASHFTVFITGYLLMPTLDSGWLVANVWHNLQYILFVWMFNVKRYRQGVDPQARFLSFISQQRNAILYFMVTVVITSIIYGSIVFFTGFFASTAALVIVYQTINFHHYIVDAVIWRASWIKKDHTPQEPVVQPA